MALPILLVSDSGSPGYHPPFKSSSGNFYVIVNNPSVPKMYKATDPADSWTIVDSVGDPVTTATGFSAVQSGDIIHIAAWDTVGTYTYHSFSMASDLWVVIDELIDNPNNNPDQPWISIAVRSDGDVIVAYAGDTDQNMGSTKERVDYARREGGTWTVGIALDAGGDVHYGNPNCVLGTNDGVHFIWLKETRTLNDPPIVYGDQEGRTLDSSNILSTVSIKDGSGPEAALLGNQNLVTYDDAGTQRIISAGAKDASGITWLVKPAIEDGSGDIDITSSFTDNNNSDDPYVNGEAAVMTLGELNGALHQLAASGGTAGVDQDLYYRTSTNDGVSWTTPTEELDAITCNFISANIYVRGSDTVMAYVYDDGGVQKYNEKVLIAGAAPDFLPYYPKRTNILLRM